MRTPPTQAMEGDACARLRDKVIETIRSRWIRPNYSAEPMARVASSEVMPLSQRVLDTLLTRQYRVGKLPPPWVHMALLQRVSLRVQRGQPIRISIGYSPLKNPNTVPYGHCDWSEFFSLCHLAAWHNKVQAVYPPGLQIKIVFDDSTLILANRADHGRMSAYINSIRRLIPALGLERLIVGTMRQSSFAWIFHFGFYQIARHRVRRWEADPANRAQLKLMQEYAERNVPVPAGLTSEQRERYVYEASHRYRVYWEALQLSGLTRSKSRIIAMYLDGNQHHLRDALALHLTTVAKGQVTQPWQGQGALLDNGHGELVPYVLTRTRRAEDKLTTLNRLDLLPLDGFDQISVAHPT